MVMLTDGTDGKYSLLRLGIRMLSKRLQSSTGSYLLGAKAYGMTS